MSALPVRMHSTCMPGACQVWRGCWSSRWLWGIMPVSGTEPGSSAGAASALAAEPFLQLRFSPFYSVWNPSQWDGVAHIRVAFPSLVKPFWKHCQRHTTVILNTVKLTMEIRLDKGAHSGQDLASPSRGPRSSQLCTRQRFVVCVEKAHSE